MQTFDFEDGNGPVAASQHRNPDGTLGGWVAATAVVTADVYVQERARVYGNAQVFEHAMVRGNAWVYGEAMVYGNARVSGNTQLGGLARVFDGLISAGVFKAVADEK